MIMIELWWSSKLAVDRKEQFKDFAQRMINRLIQGQARYGSPKREQQYYKRLELEIKAYKKNGNAEHLYNIANYCVLESMTPAHPKFHFDSSVDSVTRSKF